MQQSMALAKGARITGGVFCALFFLNSAYWLGVDLSTFGMAGVWESWLGDRKPGTDAVTNPLVLGMAIVQLSATIAAFAARRTAGGLLAVATTLTFATGVQVMISTGNSTDLTRYFVSNVDRNSATFLAVFLNSLALAFLAFCAAIVLLAGMRAWPRATPSDPPMRPGKAAGTVSGLVLGAMALCYLAWHIYVLVQNGVDSFSALYLGKGTLTFLLDLSPGWYSLVLLALTAIAGLNCLMRGCAARGLAIGLAALLLPKALVTTIVLAGHDVLFQLSEYAPGLSVINHIQLFLDLLGSLAMLALMGKGEPVAPAWQPPAQLPTFPAPGFVPGPQGPPPASWQQGPPMPQQGPPMAPPVAPPPPQGPPQGGGFGPPQY
ncbi:hypothetical protein [Streptomyces halobius]|uniref:Uncharacterized protein n=1 Tax=Streptomyces halobius TaxID=2879846 RepID=A0ABY4MC34_9ACTN|nr:hypothetical protein [Streptomyces halobius]UQA95349.1 hypothetical protein K9S39_28940 [Streptomyces halobius]